VVAGYEVVVAVFLGLAGRPKAEPGWLSMTPGR